MTAQPTPELGRGRGTPLGRPGRQHHPQSGTCVPPGQGQSDVGGAAEQQQRLRCADGVDHRTAHGRFAEFETSSQIGIEHSVRIDLAAYGKEVVQPRVHPRNVAALSRESLAR